MLLSIFKASSYSSSHTRCYFYEGLFEESFMIFPLCHYIIAIGPFYPYSLNKDYQEQLANNFLKHSSHRSKEELLSYMALVPHFPINNVRNLLIAIDAFLTHNLRRLANKQFINCCSIQNR